MGNDRNRLGRKTAPHEVLDGPGALMDDHVIRQARQSPMEPGGWPTQQRVDSAPTFRIDGVQGYDAPDASFPEALEESGNTSVASHVLSVLQVDEIRVGAIDSRKGIFHPIATE
jgi:hypothetical protein